MLIKQEELRKKLTRELASSLDQMRCAETESLQHGEYIGQVSAYTELLIWLKRKSILKNGKE
tara:strand:- start:524 stop:709 length:186 start_codon:yes stop_codon:yes gene_type:complete